MSTAERAKDLVSCALPGIQRAVHRRLVACLLGRLPGEEQCVGNWTRQLSLKRHTPPLAHNCRRRGQTGFEDQYSATGLRELRRGRQPGRSGAENKYIRARLAE